MYKENFFDLFKINEDDISSLRGTMDILHNGIGDGNYAYPGEFISIFIKTPRSILTKNVNLILFDAYNPTALQKATANFEYTNFEFSCFHLKIKAPNLPTLLYFYVEIETPIKIYGTRGKNGILNFSITPPKDNFYQITITENTKNQDISGIIYHIFVDRFYKSSTFPIWSL